MTFGRSGKGTDGIEKKKKLMGCSDKVSMRERDVKCELNGFKKR